MKYFILSRTESPTAIVGMHSWNYMTNVSSLSEVNTFMKSFPDKEFKVIKGSELEWDIETEEVVTTKTIVKSKKLKESK